jgi:hypothetical protein
MLKDRRLRIAWLADKGVMQMLERPSEAEIADRAKKYFRWRLEVAVAALSGDSSALAEVLNEVFVLVIGEDEIIGWRPPALEEMLLRLEEPLTSCTHDAHP